MATRIKLRRMISYILLAGAGMLIFSTFQNISMTHSAPRGSIGTAGIIIHREPPARKEVVYKDLSHCPPRPDYLPGLRAHCWRECLGQDKLCTSSSASVSTNVTFCVPNLHLVGVRKCGTTDLHKWFRQHMSVVTTNQDYHSPADMCPTEYFKSKKQSIPSDGKSNYYNDGPGTIMLNRIVSDNSTHRVVTTGVQVLAYMSTPDTRFLVQMRNPSDRVISYLFHWHRLKAIYKSTSHEDFNADIVHNIITDCLKELTECLEEEDELVCFFQEEGRDGNLKVLLRHSLYVIFIEEAFKFIDRKQFIFTTMSEYSTDQVATINQVMNYFGLQFQKSSKYLAQEVRNTGIKNEVWPKTLKLLDDFFKPYNIRLASLLKDDKWLFIRDHGFK